MSSASKLDLVLPGVVERWIDWSHRSASMPSFPVIEQFLSVSDKSETGASGYESTLWKLFDPLRTQQEELTAGIQLSGGGGGQVCCADPVHLRLETSSLVLVDQSQFPFSDADRTAFSELINEYLESMGGRYFFDANGLGFLGLKEPRWVNTTPLTQVMGNSIDSMMPEGEQKACWHQLMNELQMLLHSAPFNEARTKRGEPMINALWIWGTGLPQRTMEPQYSGVYCNDPLAGELSRSVGIPAHPVPPKFDSSLTRNPGQHLLVLNDLLPHSQYDDYPGWHVIMERLCTDWLSPLLDAVRKKRLSRLSLYLCNGTCYVLEPGYQWRFWRRTKPLLSHLT